MFAVPPIVKKFVVIGRFKNQEWYLADAGHSSNATIRKWTAHPNHALKFNDKSDAEQIAELVCPDNIEYKIGGISKTSR